MDLVYTGTFLWRLENMEGSGANAAPPAGDGCEDAELQVALAMSLEGGEAAESAAGEAAAAEAAPEVEPLSFRVTHRKDVLRLSMPPSATVSELHAKLEELTGIPPTMQKVMFKGGLKDKTKTLADVGIKSGVKMMLVGSKQADIAKLKAAEEAVKKEPTPAEAKAAEKKPLCEEKEHKRVLDKGKPADAEPVTRHPAAPASPGS